MTYFDHSFAPSVQAGADLMAQLDTDLLSVGFTLHDTFVVGQDVTNIYKSAAALNGVKDWYLLVRRTSLAATPQYGVCEAYNATTDKATLYAPNTQSLTPVSTAGATQYGVNDATGLAPNAAGLFYVTGVSVSNSGFFRGVWSLTPKRVIIGTRISNSDGAAYVGLYDDLLPASISPAPLCAIRMLRNSTVVTNGSTTREPGQTVSAVWNFLAYLPSGGGGAFNSDSQSIAQYGEGSYWHMARVPLVSSRSQYGVRGYLKDVFESAGICQYLGIGDKAHITNPDGSSSVARVIANGSNNFCVVEP